MAMDKMAIRKKIAGATVSKGGNFLRDGRGRLVLREFELSGGHKGDKAVFRFVVKHSTKIPVFSEKQNKALDIEPNAAGTTATYMQKLNQDIAWPKIKEVVLALFDETEVGEDELVEVLTEMEENKAAFGRSLDYETRRIVTEKKGIEIVVPDWTPVKQSDEDIVKARSWIESLALGTVTEAEKEAEEAAA